MVSSLVSSLFQIMLNLLRVLQCLKLGRRLPEAQFSNLKIAAKGQQSVYGMFKKVNSTDYSEAY